TRIFAVNPLTFWGYMVIASIFQLVVELLFSDQRGNLGNWQLQMATATAQLLTDVAFILILAWGLSTLNKGPLSFNAFINKKLKSLVAESLRAISHILLWTLALILPGFYKYLLYIFVSYVVFFE